MTRWLSLAALLAMLACSRDLQQNHRRDTQDSGYGARAHRCLAV